MIRSIVLLMLLSTQTIFAGDTLNILFVYGSKPLVKGEKKIFGGKHGGHVSIKYKEGYASFVHNGRLHIFPKKRRNSTFIIEKDKHFREDTSISRYVIIDMPVSALQAATLDSILTERLKNPGYDYAFLGFRCASSAYEVLSAAGIYKRPSMFRIKFKYFYPKILRKKILGEAKKKHWKLFFRQGTTRRKWESD